MEPKCPGGHKIFVAEVVAVEAEGKVCVLTVCTACGKTACKTFKISDKPAILRLLLEDKKEKHEHI